MSGGNMSFYSSWSEQQWDHIRLQLYGKTKRDVEHALAKPVRTLDDFIALLSPAAETYLPTLAEQSHALTLQRFGRTMQLYIPLYLSNLCSNDCTYCGFSMSNKLKRKTLSLEEVEAECLAIKAKGYDTLLVVTGEHETKVGMPYFKQVVPLLKKHFSYVMFEVQPLHTEDYAELRQLGLDAVMVYQETYNPVVYAEHHIRGKKRDFRWRLETPDRLGQAGVDKIGLAALIGLTDWRIDSAYTAMHLLYLQKRYWRSRYSISFPRLRPCTGGLENIQSMSDKQLTQLICAYRLCFPDIELSLSTRESPRLRDGLFQLGITSISAESQTQPGGYATPSHELEQFAIDDDRSTQTIVQILQQQGIQPVWKDWFRFEADPVFNRDDLLFKEN